MCTRISFLIGTLALATLALLLLLGQKSRRGKKFLLNPYRISGGLEFAGQSAGDVYGDVVNVAVDADDTGHVACQPSRDPGLRYRDVCGNPCSFALALLLCGPDGRARTVRDNGTR